MIARLLRAVLGAMLIAGIGSPIAAPGLTVIEPIAAPALHLPDRLSKPSSLQALRGKVVLVNFWATYCKPCREEIPSLDRVRQRLAAKGFEVIGVDVADAPEAVTRYLATNPVSFPILFDPDASTMIAWKAVGLPASFLIDRQGRLRAKVIGSADWESPSLVAAIEKLLAE